MNRLALISNSPCETEELGQRLGSILTRGMFIALRGELGSGKTCFTRGVVATAAPQSAQMVASPTFAIMNEYPGEIPIYHFDFYRLKKLEEAYDIGYEEYFYSGDYCFIEWPELVMDILPESYVEIEIEWNLIDDTRNISFTKK